jgi:hypothetical protein
VKTWVIETKETVWRMYEVEAETAAEARQRYDERLDRRLVHREGGEETVQIVSELAVEDELVEA